MTGRSNADCADAHPFRRAAAPFRRRHLRRRGQVVGRNCGRSFLEKGRQALRRLRDHPRRQSRRRRRRVRGLRRPLRLREVDAAQNDRRARNHHGRRDIDRRQDRERCGAGRSRRRHGVPVLRALPAHDGRTESELRTEDDRPRQGRCRAAGQALGRHPAHLRTAQAQAAPALRWPAPARRDWPRHHARAAAVPVRRTAQQSRRRTQGANAGRASAATQGTWRHHDLRYARPDGGDDAGRQDRRSQRRQYRADRRAARSLRRSGQPFRRRLRRLAEDELHGRQDRRGQQWRG